METNNTENNNESIDDPKAVLAALDRAKNDAKKFREEKERLEVDLNSKDMKIAEFSGKLLNEKVSQKLAEEGVKDPRRLIKFLDMNKLEFDEDLNVIGFNEQFSQLKEDLPEIFDPKLRVGGQADAAIKANVSTQYSASQLQAAQILGRSN